MAVYIAIISNPDKFAGKLTKFFTGSHAYHIGFTDGTKFWDMNALFRRRLWPHYKPENVRLYWCPVEVTVDDLELELDTSTDWYGVLDYTAFAIRKLFPKWKPGSYKGAICSEKVEQILKKKGWNSPFDFTPSPADFELILEPKACNEIRPD